MTTRLWISRNGGRPEFSEMSSDWELVGELNEGRETELWRVVQGYLGLRASADRRTASFYADLSTETNFFRDLLTRHPGLAHSSGVADPKERFWLALRWSGPPPRTFVAAEQAVLAVLKRRQPEPHPGLRPSNTAAVGMRVRAGDGGFFV